MPEKIFLSEVNSTNLYVKEHLEELDDRSLVYTFHQTAGRGRLERKWKFTGKDNIYMTFVLKPDRILKKEHANLTQYLSVVLCRVISRYGLNPNIKWPNDVLINNKKVAGILSESVVRGMELSGIALGAGVNLNAEKEMFFDIDKPASALNLELGRKIDKNEFLSQLYSDFFLYYDKFLNEGFLCIKEEYLSRAAFINQNIKVSCFNSIMEGRAVDITSNGALVLKDKNNKLNNLWIGDIL